MAFNASKWNKNNSKFTFKTPADFVYQSLTNLYTKNGADAIYLVKALFINRKSQYGDAPVIVTDHELVNAPKHMLETVEQMIADDETVEAINNNEVAFRIYEYSNTNGVFRGLEFVAVDEFTKSDTVYDELPLNA